MVGSQARAASVAPGAEWKYIMHARAADCFGAGAAWQCRLSLAAADSREAFRESETGGGAERP